MVYDDVVRFRPPAEVAKTMDPVIKGASLPIGIHGIDIWFIRELWMDSETHEPAFPEGSHIKLQVG
jgi:hypothetical protein